MPKPDAPVRTLRNLGSASARWLEAVGIRTYADLRAAGAVGAFEKVRAAGFRPTLNLLYALAGALTDTAWTDLSDEAKGRLREAVADSDARDAVAQAKRPPAGPTST
ncbi:hypothetical protein Mal4_43860 [Maioricimonas rarisocia]|uniref:TfoX C-terminal domain-containing protein n=1 Tax=Maioricimonas rarisocia TaxID=2528026 RepID=A0A517ZC54_9PLAN|nr:TfoX/Sxy family protein [Maioricimonas rarisocia]QDU40032.1 hypothetical protein Mal4_43860 [Maioricimonas rarisocia]